MAAELNKRVDISIVLFNALALPSIERNLLEHLVSLLTHPFCHRRSCLSLLHRTHKWLRSLSYGQTCRWASDVHDELRICALTLLICESHVKWPIETRISATDATPSRGGSCYTIVSQKLAQALYETSEQKGASVTLRSALETLPDIETGPEVDQFFRSAPWIETRNRDFPETQHVNLQEFQEIASEIEESVALGNLPVRLVNGSDSKVGICAKAKGRSPSLLLNGLLRRSAVVELFCRRDGSNVKVDTKSNPADAPSRKQALPKPEIAPEWLETLLPREKVDASWSEKIPMSARMFREGFAGCGNLSRHMLKQGIPVARPQEPYPASQNQRRKSQRYIRVNDLMCPDVYACVEREIDFGLYTYYHFGICCGGWGKANEMNGGTRTMECPMGGGKGKEVLEREMLANEMAVAVCKLCVRLYTPGCFFSLENPLTSHLWLSDPFLDLRAVCGDHLVLVDFHQCQFGLRLPGSKANQFCKKATRIATNMATLSQLSRFCPGVSAAHAHDVAWGAVKVRGKWLSKAAAAGQYPDQLCHEWSLLAAAAIGDRFWKGPCPWRGH